MTSLDKVKLGVLCVIHYNPDEQKVTVTEKELGLDIVIEKVSAQKQLPLPFRWESKFPPEARNDHWM
jgi:hypothetical protein